MKTLKRRRGENKTDYGKRLSLLKGHSPRIAFRKSNRYVVAQYITSSEAQDKVIMGTTSKILLKHGWPEDMNGSLKSLPASYLTGFYLGKKMLEKKLSVPIVDLGMIRNVNKSRAFAFVKGIVDSGVKVKYEEASFPSEERIKGKNLKRDFSVIFAKVKKQIDGIKNEGTK
nr:50S ribosomal protein L18P [uncultured archaeon]